MLALLKSLQLCKFSCRIIFFKIHILGEYESAFSHWYEEEHKPVAANTSARTSGWLQHFSLFENLQFKHNPIFVYMSFCLKGHLLMEHWLRGFLLSYCYILAFNNSMTRNVNAFRRLFTNMGAKLIDFETISVITTKFLFLSALPSIAFAFIQTHSHSGRHFRCFIHALAHFNELLWGCHALHPEGSVESLHLK